jgi:hypothetical protein
MQPCDRHRTVSATRIVILLLVLFLACAAPAMVYGAALPVDAYLAVENDSVIGGAYAVGGSWKTVNISQGIVVTTKNAHAMRGPVSVNGVEYSGASTQALELDDDAHGQYIQFSASANHPIISFGGFLNVGARTNYALLDAFYIDNTSGYPWLVAPQIIADGGNCTPCIQEEGAVGYSTVHGNTKFPIQAGKTYWFSSKIDWTTGILYLGLYDPDNDYAVVKETTLSVDKAASSSKLVLRMGRQDAHTGNNKQGTKSYMDNIIIDWTNHAYPLIPGPGSPIVKPMPPKNLQVQ